MSILRSPSLAINEIEAYSRAAKSHPKVVKNIKKTIKASECDSTIRKAVAKRKSAAKHRELWIKDTKDAGKMLVATLKKVRFSKKVIKAYNRDDKKIVAAFAKKK